MRNRKKIIGLFKKKENGNFFIIKKTYRIKTKKKTLHELKKTALKNNKKTYKAIEKTIEEYSASKKKQKIDEMDLWECAGYPSAIQTILYIIKYDEKLLSIFELSQDIVRVAKHTSSRGELDILCNDKIRSNLLRKIGSQALVEIASKIGGARTLRHMAKEENWKGLILNLSTENIIRIAKNNGAKGVLELLKDPLIWENLRKKIGKDGIITISSHTGARNILEKLIDNKKWDTLLKRIGKKDIIKIGSHPGGDGALETILSDEQWEDLTTKLPIESVKRIMTRDGGTKTIEVIADRVLKEKLIQRIGEETLYKICNRCGARQILNELMSNEKWTLLKERIKDQTLKNILHNSGTVAYIKFITDNKRWKQFEEIVGKNNIDNILKTTPNIKSIENVLSMNENLKGLLKKKHMTNFALIEPEDQSGLTNKVIEKLIYEYQLNMEAIIFLTKISGRHLEHILTLIETYPYEIKKLFGEYTDLIKEDKKYLKYPLYTHLNKHQKSILIVAKIHQQCKQKPLTLYDLKYVKNTSQQILINVAINLNREIIDISKEIEINEAEERETKKRRRENDIDYMINTENKYDEKEYNEIEKTEKRQKTNSSLPPNLLPQKDSLELNEDTMKDTLMIFENDDYFTNDDIFNTALELDTIYAL